MQRLRAFQVAWQTTALPSLARWAAPVSTTAPARGLEELIVTLPGEKDPPPATGRAWQAADLRRKGWDDLHKLWYVLLKERNRLRTERLAYKAERQPMPAPHRSTAVRKSMGRIKQVMGERLAEHEDAEARMKLKAFIDAL